MKCSAIFVAGLVFAVSCASALGADVKRYPQGTIMFAQNLDGSGKTCGLPFVTSIVDFREDGAGCTNDEYSYFRLDNVPSAGVFRLDSERCAGTSQKWNFEMKTYIQPVTTGWVSIPTLAAEAVGTIVEKGIILVSKKIDTSEPIQGKLSCVRITRSELP